MTSRSSSGRWPTTSASIRSISRANPAWAGLIGDRARTWPFGSIRGVVDGWQIGQFFGTSSGHDWDSFAVRPAPLHQPAQDIAGRVAGVLEDG